MTNNPPSTRLHPGEYGYPLKLKPRYDNFIGGNWIAPVDGEYYSNLTPVTGQPLCEIASSGKKTSIWRWMRRIKRKRNGHILRFRTEPPFC